MLAVGVGEGSRMVRLLVLPAEEGHSMSSSWMGLECEDEDAVAAEAAGVFCCSTHTT